MANEQDPIQTNDEPILIQNTDKKFGCLYEKLLADTYRKDEIIAFFEKSPEKAVIERHKESFRGLGIDPKTITYRRCDNCDIPVVLYHAKNLHTCINTDGVRAAAGTPVETVGESLNFYNYLPYDNRGSGQYLSKGASIRQKKGKVVVAVLDTGFDKRLVNPRYLWSGTDKNSNCYADAKEGWNFINDTPDFNDDNKPGKHGSTVSQYIINEFEESPYDVEIMALKTHDKDGIGDLFNIICAIHFAMKKGARIINASWGFYYYHETPMPYLVNLITNDLKKEGILFVTAAGNQVKEQNDIARQIWLLTHPTPLTDEQLRNLQFHNFYPAHLSSKENNVITVTTTNGEIVSQTQNFSNRYTDLGIMADLAEKDGSHMFFKVPFPGSVEYISGTSFATAIATGIIGANINNPRFIAGISKPDIIRLLPNISDTPTGKKYIINGAFIKRH